jgi:hypothetical protein
VFVFEHQASSIMSKHMLPNWKLFVASITGYLKKLMLTNWGLFVA